jgi:PLP dependent protein
MKINENILEKIRNWWAKLVFVTKYFDGDFTKEVIENFKDDEVFFWIGENRIEAIKEKNIPFIGNIQSRKIHDIVKYCDYIHSFSEKKYFPLFDKFAEEENKKMKIFLQIHLDNIKKNGILKSEVDYYIAEAKKYKNIEIIGISGIGKYEFSREEKLEEIALLKNIQENYPQLKISFWTSADWEIALEYRIEVLRIGKSLFL